MGLIEDLVAKVQDDYLRTEIQSALATLKRQRRFGLVFEEHIPEMSALLDYPVRPGALVELRREPESRSRFRVVSLTHRGSRARLAPESGEGDETVLPVCDLVVVKPFGEPIYPALRSVGSVERGGPKPHHAVIDAENFHALQLLVYLYRGQVDCIYVDPPYNTGARDWKYNNHYVDGNDTWRHSKWLSMMDRRLRLAKKLLKPNGVLIVTIDENEGSHLGLLLEQLFPEARRQMVSVCINPSGASGQGLSRVDEYAYFCFLGDAQPVATPDDMLSPIVEADGATVEWESLLRRGNAWYRESRRNLCYPVVVDPESQRIVDVGPPLKGKDEDRPLEQDGFPLAWPVRTDGRLGIWRVDGARLRTLAKAGYAYVSSQDESRGTWTIRYLMSGTINDIEAGDIAVIGSGEYGQVLLEAAGPRETTAKTMWHRGRHTAGGSGGTQILSAYLGERNLFPFPKSVYAVRDCLAAAVGDRKDALVLDFFAGSGTTFHATAMLNAADGGSRRSLMVTNNEVDEAQARRLNRQGAFRGDPEFDWCGIFERVSRPRCEAVVRGVRKDGTPVPGADLDGRPYADGFDENIEFFRLGYLDPDEVDLGTQFDAILPALWLAAGGVGSRESVKAGGHYTIPADSTYAVLFRESRFRQFREALAKRPDVTHAWLVTDSDEAFSEMSAILPGHLKLSMLYRDYLRNFRINTDKSL